MTTSPPRILVVDDDHALRENLEEALLLEGFEVAVAANGVSALTRLHNEAFDAVLIDLVMPGMDGRELVRRIREVPRLAELPVVVSTGHSGPHATAGVPADGFLFKPFGVRELLTALHDLGLSGGGADDTAA